MQRWDYENLRGRSGRSGTVTSNNTQEYYRRWTGTSGDYNCYSVEVTGLSFTPSLIVLRSKTNRDIYVIVFPTSFNGDSPEYRVAISQAGGAFETTSPGYISNTGFKIPVWNNSNVEFEWWACE